MLLRNDYDQIDMHVLRIVWSLISAMKYTISFHTDCYESLVTVNGRSLINKDFRSSNQNTIIPSINITVVSFLLVKPRTIFE